MARNVIKLSFSEDSVMTHDGNKVSTCMLGAELKMPEELSKALGFSDKCLHFYVSTSATCCSEDVFNAETGSKIVFARAENKAYAKAWRLLYSAWLKQNDEADRSAGRTTNSTINAFLEKAERCIAHNLEYIKRLSE